jgi:hypothetical protein
MPRLSCRHVLLLAVMLGASAMEPPVRVVVAADADPVELTAAEELRHFIGLATGHELPAATDPVPPDDPTPRIVVGPGPLTAELAPKLDAAAMGGEEYVLRSVGPHLVIVGGRPRGTLHGAYGWLQDHCGVRFLTPEVTHVPPLPSVPLGGIDERRAPAFVYREPLYHEALRDPVFFARIRANGYSCEVPVERGGRIAWATPHHHTMGWLMDTDPAWQEALEDTFLTSEGRRGGFEPCYTSERAAAIMTQRVLMWMREQPDKHLFSVSQFDGPYWCHCERCAAVEIEHGAKSATLLTFINRIADGVRGEFPRNRIVTFAYAWSFAAPKKPLKPRDNVVIQVAPIGGHSEDGVDQVAAWAQLVPAGNLIAWDYFTGFTHYTIPFPVTWRIAAEVRKYHRLGYRGLLAQANYGSSGGSFQELNLYVARNLLWDPSWDVDRGVDEFLRLYYGPAAPPIRRFLELLNSDGYKELSSSTAERVGAAMELRDRDRALAPLFEGMWTAPHPTLHLHPAKITAYIAALDEAERLTGPPAPAAFAARVRLARLQVLTIQILMAKPGAQRECLIDRWIAIATEWNITHAGEGKPMAQWLQDHGRAGASASPEPSP